MNRCSQILFALSLVACLVLAAMSVADEEPAGLVTAEQAQAAALRLWSVMEAVLDNHVTPPTRQQMLLQGMRAISKQKQGESSDDLDQQLARAVSDLSGHRETLDFFAMHLSRASQTSGSSLDKLATTFVHGALEAVPGGARYIPAKDSAVEQQLLENRYVGIGIALALGINDEYPAMFKVIPRGPAHRAGAQEGDLMLSIDGQDIKGMSVQNVVPMLRGQAGIPVSIVVRQPDSQNERTLTITRGEVPIQTVEGQSHTSAEEWNYHVPPAQDKDIAYIKITSIRGSTVSELRETARKLHSQGFRALILDLRETESGELRHAAMISDLLLEEGVIGAAVVRGHRQKFTSNADHLFPGWPMAVLVDANTIGQAEWIAASVQHRQNTVLVGGNTPGLGYVTDRIKLPDGAAIELQTGFLERASGRSLVSAGADDRSQQVIRRVVQIVRQRDIFEGAKTPAGWNGVAPDVTVGDAELLSTAASKLTEKLAAESAAPKD